MPSPEVFVIVEVPSSIATDGLTKRMDWIETLICIFGCAWKIAAKVCSIASRPWTACPSSLTISPSGAKRAANALASWALDALVKASTFCRIAFSSSARDGLGEAALTFPVVAMTAAINAAATIAVVRMA